MSERAEADEATRGSAVKLGAELLSRGLQLGTSLVLTRGLGAEAFGAFAAASVFALVAAEAADFGLHGTAGRALVARTTSLGAIVRAKVFLSVPFLLAALVLAAFFPLLGPLLLWFLGSGWAEILGVALRARGRRGQEALVLVVLRLGGLVLAAGSLARGGSVVDCAWALAASTLPATLLGAALVGRAERGEPAVAGGLTATPALLRTSWPLAVNGGLALLSLRVEQLVVKAVAGALENGYFSAAVQIVQVLNSTLPTSLCAGALPQLTREALRESGSGDAVRRRTAGLIAFAAWPAAIGLALVAPAVSDALYGAAYAPSAPTLAVLAAGLVPLFLNALFTHALIAAERARVLPRLTAVRVVLAVLLAAGLVPLWGGPGAALGFVLSETALLALGVRATRQAGFPIPIARVSFLALLASLPMAGVVLPLRGQVLVAVPLGALVYGVTLLLLSRSKRLRLELGYP